MLNLENIMEEESYELENSKLTEIRSSINENDRFSLRRSQKIS